MTAQAPEASQDSFTLDSLVDVVRFEMSFEKLYPGRVWEFALRMETGEDAEHLREKFAGRKVGDHEQRVERLARLLVEPPSGFSDFPQAGNLEENARRYFAPKRAEQFVRSALNNYDRVVAPDQLFR